MTHRPRDFPRQKKGGFADPSAALTAPNPAEAICCAQRGRGFCCRPLTTPPTAGPGPQSESGIPLHLFLLRIPLPCEAPTGMDMRIALSHPCPLTQAWAPYMSLHQRHFLGKTSGDREEVGEAGASLAARDTGGQGQEMGYH